MKSKTLGFLIILVALLGGIFLWGRIRTSTSQQSSVTFPTISAETIDRIVIKREAEGIEVVKGENGWKIDDKTVSEEKIGKVWSAFQNMKISGPVSTKKEFHHRFEVDVNGRDVDFRKGDSSVLHLIMGKTEYYPSLSTYLRFPDQDAVYTVGQDWESVFSTEEKEWTSTKPEEKKE